MHKNKGFSLVAWFICMIGAIFFCYEYLLRIEPSVMVSGLMKQFGVMATGFGLIAASYYYVYTPMQLFVGVLIDKYGSRLMLGLGIVACTFGSFLFSISVSVYVATFARMFIGFGSAFAFVGVLKLGSEWLPKQHFALFVGIATSLGMLGGMFGDIFLVHLIEKMGYQKVLHLGTVAGLILIPVIFMFVHDTPEAKKKSKKESVSFKELFIGFKGMLKSPQMWVVGVIANTLYLSLTAFAELWGIKFLETVYSFGEKQASFVCSMVFLGWLVGAPVSGWLSDHIKSRKKPIVIGSIFSAIIILIVILKPFGISYIGLSVLLFLFGFFSSAEVICFAISRESNPRHLAATALAFINFIVMLGGVIFQPLIGILLDLHWTGNVTDGIRVYSPATYQVVFMVIPVSIIIGALLAVKLKETIK